MDVDRVAEDLYALAPGSFVAARDERAAAARREGDAAAASAIKKLRKPTTSAWLANLLVREQGDGVNELVELGSGLRAAQRALAADQLRDLSRRRRELVDALRHEAQEAGRRAGVPVGDAAADEVAGTLEAAVADPEAADMLRSGRLTSPLRYAGTGFGGIPPAPAGAGAGADTGTGIDAVTRPGRPRPGGGAGSRRPDTAARSAAATAVKEAAQRVAAAQENVTATTRELADVGAALDEATARARDLERQKGAVERRLADADGQLREAERAAAIARGALGELENLEDEEGRPDGRRGARRRHSPGTSGTQ